MALAQTFHDHIKELRKRILWVVLSIGLCAGLAYGFRVPIINTLQHPLGAPLFYTSPAGSFNFILKLSMVFGLFISLPLMVYHLIRFIEPALPIRVEKRVIVGVISATCFLALAGAAFGFFLMIPMSLHFFGSYASEAVKPLITAEEYLSFVLNHMLTFALAFQIPTVFLFINRIKPLSPKLLLKYQRHVIVGAFGLAVVLPFTYDPLSQFIVAIPVVFLYYVSIVMIWFINRRPKQVKPKFEVKQLTSPVQVTITRPAIIPETEAPGLLKPKLSMDGFVGQINNIASSSPVLMSGFADDKQPEPVKTQRGYRRLSGRPIAIDGISQILPSSF